MPLLDPGAEAGSGDALELFIFIDNLDAMFKIRPAVLPC
jgi:hypothetical protein